MLTDDQLIRLLQQLEPGAGPDRATLERMFEGIDAERARRRRDVAHRWLAGVARLIPRVAAPVVMLAILMTVLFGLTLGMWVGGWTPVPKVAPLLASPPLRPPATVIMPSARI
ncbi:MAG: hypothetical protein WED87_05560, partial [Dehalococcoidia bacterium]